MINRFTARLLLHVVSFTSVVTMLLPLSAQAAAGETIKSFDSVIVIDRSGTANVTETISYDFGNGQRHGIYRYIPTKMVDDQNRHYQTIISEVKATQDGAHVPANLSQDSNNLVIKLGDPNHTITGSHIYTVNYRLSPVVMRQTDGDLLRYNVTGNGWGVSIEAATVKVSSPGSAPPTAATCYTGVQGSETKNCLSTAVTDGYQIKTTSTLQSAEGLTVDVAWPAGSFSNYLIPGQIHFSVWQIATIIMSAFGILLILIALVRLGLKRWSAIRLKHSQTVVAQYEPPDKLTPAELGFISDDKIDLIEITATLLDLAVRGYLKINQTSPRRFAGIKPAQYTFSKLKEGTGLETYEAAIFNAVFSAGPEVSLSDLDRSKMSEAVKSVKTEVEERLKIKGFYRVALGKTKRTLIGTGGFFALVFLLVYTGFFLAGPVVLAMGLLANYVVSNMRQSTQLGVEEWAKVEGFKLFLKVTAADRLKFTDAPDKTPELFSKLLPYAVALKVEKQWSKQFEGIDISPATNNWYYSSHGGYTSVLLAADLSDNFASAIATNFTPANSSSSGFGGGFSGGGAGGGGGGSW